MKPIEPEELSALLDGELPPDRADHVRRAMAEDPALRRLCDQLAALDAGLKARASAMVFQPRLNLAEVLAEEGTPVLGRALLVGVSLVLLRLAVRLAPLAVGAAVHAALLALALAWLLTRLVRATDEDRQHLLQGHAASSMPTGQ